MVLVSIRSREGSSQPVKMTTFLLTKALSRRGTTSEVFFNVLGHAAQACRWTKPWRADREDFIAFTQGTDIVENSPDKSGSPTNKMKLASGNFFGCVVAAYLNVG
jgi:hypothetical protein